MQRDLGAFLFLAQRRRCTPRLARDQGSDRQGQHQDRAGDRHQPAARASVLARELVRGLGRILFLQAVQLLELLEHPVLRGDRLVHEQPVRLGAPAGPDELEHPVLDRHGMGRELALTVQNPMFFGGERMRQQRRARL